MPDLLSNQRDMEFTIFEQLRAEELCAHKPYEEFSRDLFEMIMSESLKMSVREAMPLNTVGDREGCRMEDGQVKVPKAFQEPWKLFTDWGWIVLTEPPEVGGQGIPQVIGLTCLEHALAANYSFYSFLSLTKGAARLIQNFGTDEQKDRYMFKMLEGQWAGTMCLTEPNAGSDVGAVKTTARRNPDGTFSITGSKIFITDGDHDLTENIIHPVLARIEGAPAGTRGISLFLVPKYRVNDDGSLGEFNDVKVTGIEEKMGLHGSPTCAMNFGEDGKCVGELLGEENRGMRIMFQMMNEARLGVGLAGLALASTAYLHSLEYAKERVQGTDFRDAGNPGAPGVPIIRHPDVRRMLMYMKCLVEGMRGMIYYSAYCMDRVNIATDGEERSKWQGFVDLLIPVVKGYSSDMGFRVVETAMQVYGGYGYVNEYPVEQFLRDCKITSIFEGTNGIQAMDLVGRKLGMKGGSIFDLFLDEIGAFVALAEENKALREEIDKLEVAMSAVSEVGILLRSQLQKDATRPLFYAHNFLHLFGDLVIGWQLLWQASIAGKKLGALIDKRGGQTREEQEKLIQESRDAAFYSGKIAAAEFFANSFLILSPGKAQTIKNGDTSAMEISEAAFA